MNSTETPLEEKKTENFWPHRLVEILFPLFIAIFAAMLSINDLLSNDISSLEMKLGNLRNNNYQWYQSKGIKTTILEGQREMLATLILAGTIEKAQAKQLRRMLMETDKKLERYNKEKKEILLGSNVVGEANWIQDVDGKLGQIVGAKEYDAALAVLEESDNFFDYASMMFQISMVMGAVGIMLSRPKVKILFLIIMLMLGAAGMSLGGHGYSIARTVSFFE